MALSIRGGRTSVQTQRQACRRNSGSREAVRLRAQSGSGPGGGSNNSGPDEAQEEPQAAQEGLEPFNKLMAFNGPVPELVNGRLAMVAFTSCLIGELKGKQTALEQFQLHYNALIIHAVLFTIATIIPAAVSSNSLKSLMDTATKDGLPKEINFMHRDVEMLNGRAAMVGLAGLLAIEAITRKPLLDITALVALVTGSQ